jgi:hypothetical protein
VKAPTLILLTLAALAATLMVNGCDSRSDRFEIHASDKAVVRLDKHSGEVAIIPYGGQATFPDLVSPNSEEASALSKMAPLKGVQLPGLQQKFDLNVDLRWISGTMLCRFGLGPLSDQMAEAFGDGPTSIDVTFVDSDGFPVQTAALRITKTSFRVKKSWWSRATLVPLGNWGKVDASYPISLEKFKRIKGVTVNAQYSAWLKQLDGNEHALNPIRRSLPPDVEKLLQSRMKGEAGGEQELFYRELLPSQMEGK